MFRRSFQVLLAAALLALAMVVGYATFRLSGPAEAIAEAEQLLAADKPLRAIAVLDLCERSRSLLADPDLRRRLWRLRLAAYSDLHNTQGALADVEKLLADGAVDAELRLEQIRLLAEAGEGTRALQLARTFLEEQPGNGKALELAGEACAAAYAATLDEVQKKILREVRAADHQRVRRALASYLHGPEGDPEVEQGLEVLARIYAADARLSATWQPLSHELSALRLRVQQGLTFSLSSLEANDEPEAAFARWTTSLTQCGRVDDLLMACEIHRRRSKGQTQFEAGRHAVWTMIEHGSPAAAVAASERWLPTQRFQALLDAKKVGDEVMDIVLGRAIAGWRLRDKLAIGRSSNDCGALLHAEFKAPVLFGVVFGLLNHMNMATPGWKDGASGAVNNLGWALAWLPVTSLGPESFDLLSEIMPPRIDALRTTGANDIAVTTEYEKWIKLRPALPEPRLQLARFLAERGRTTANLAILTDAYAADPANQELASLYFDAARTAAAQAGPDGALLLQQCLQRRALVPDAPNPIGYLLCAEEALARQFWDVARESARMAADAFPRTRRPRLLEIEACLRGGRASEAAALADRLLQMLLPDEPTALLALQARTAAGQLTRDLLAIVMPVCRPSAALRIEVLRAALAGDPKSASTFAAGVVDDPAAPPALRVLSATAMAKNGSAPVQRAAAVARTLLDQALAANEALPAASAADLTEALCAWIEAAAKDVPDEELALAVARYTASLGQRGALAQAPTLHTAAAILMKRPRTAHELCAALLTSPTPAARSGEAFALAGAVASKLGMFQLAEQHWLAAVAFPDGRTVAEDLARLCLAQGRTERALLVYEMVDAGTDAALAARCGKPELAETLAKAALVADPLDLLANATLAVLDKPSLLTWKAETAPETEARLELLSLLRDDNLAAEAVVRVPLVDTEATSPIRRILRARAELACGRPDEAVHIHEELATVSPGPLLWHEVARASMVPGYTLSKPLEEAIGGAVTSGALTGPPSTLAFALRTIADMLERNGQTALAAETRTNLWRALPRESVRTEADIEAAGNLANLHLAWSVLDHILPDQRGELRTKVRERIYVLAESLMAQKPPDAAEIYGAAVRHADTEGPHGCIVHFLLDHAADFPAQRPDDKRTIQLLEGQLRLAAAGEDSATWIPRSVDRLAAARGTVPALATVEDLQRRYPACLPLWLARATLLARRQDAAAGLGDLRAVLAHAHAPDMTLEYLLLAAGNGALSPADQALLESLPAELREGTSGKFVRGLVALRLGKPDDAVPLLTGAPARPDGLHLWSLALASLQSGSAEGAETARTTLMTLARDYASSSLARNAGSFAAQLAPR